MKLVLLMLKNLRRNLVRTTLTCLAVFVLVLVVTMIWSFIHMLDSFTTARAGEQKGLIMEKWQFPSQLPWKYAYDLETELKEMPEEYRPTPIPAAGLDEKGRSLGALGVKTDGIMTWQFVGGSVVKEPAKRKQSDNMFLFVLDPRRIRMMDEMDDLSDTDVQKIIDNDKGVLMGRERLAMIDKKVGDRITLYSFNYKDIELELDIVGYLPNGRYAQNVVMNYKYLMRKLDEYQRKTRQPHPMMDKTLGIFWFQAGSAAAIDKIGQHLEKSGKFVSPALKTETASSGIATFIEPYRDMLWGMRYLLTPAILIVLALVIANAISISVRERRTEMAVLKVLGFRPNQILLLVLGEVLLVGIGTGLLCATLSYFGVWLMGGINFRVAFFPVFFIPVDAFWWGPVLGGITALVGSFVPAWGARSVKVSEVFSKVA